MVRKSPVPAADISRDDISRRWSLGDNDVVKRAAAELASYYLDPWFVALVPDSRENVERCITEANHYHRPGLPAWDTSA